MEPVITPGLSNNTAQTQTGQREREREDFLLGELVQRSPAQAVDRPPWPR